MDSEVTQEHPMIGKLRAVLEPLGDRAEIICAWAQREYTMRPLVAYCYDGELPEQPVYEADEQGNVIHVDDGGNVVAAPAGKPKLLGYRRGAWQVGQESPITPGFIVFAMLYWEAQRVVAAWCFKPTAVEGGVTIEFHRELIHNPKHVSGPCSHDALFADLEAFFGEDTEPTGQSNGAGTNGAHA